MACRAPKPSASASISHSVQRLLSQSAMVALHATPSGIFARPVTSTMTATLWPLASLNVERRVPGPWGVKVMLTEQDACGCRTRPMQVPAT